MNSATATAAPATVRTAESSCFAPILEASHQRIRELAGRRSTSLSHLQHAIEADPALALNLFTAVNTMLRNSGHPLVTDIPRAVLFMGITEAIEQFGKSTTLEASVERKQCGPLLRILCRAHHASCQARAIGSIVGGVNSDEILAVSLTSEALDYVAALAARTDSTPSPDAIRSFLPAPPEGADASLVSRLCLDLGSRFALATEACWDEEVLETIYTEIAEFCGRDAAAIARILKLTTVAAARAGGHFDCYPPANHLMSPGIAPGSTKPTAVMRGPKADTPPTGAVSEIARTTRAATANTPPTAPDPKPKASAVNPDPGAVRTASASPAPAVAKKCAPAPGADLEAALERLVGAVKRGKSAASILPHALQAICDHLGMGLVVFLMRGKSSGTLGIRLHRGLELPEQYLQATIDTAMNPLLARLMEREGVIHWDPTKHKSGLDRLALKLLGKKHGLFCSLHLEGKPLGIIMACRPRAELSSEQLQAFKLISRKTTQAVALSRQVAAAKA